MKITCSQMDVLISFYVEGELSPSLKSQVEEHMKNCKVCKAKYDIIKSMITDLKNVFDAETAEDALQATSGKVVSQQYHLFKDNLSAYLDNELTNDENIKIKKFTINNKIARKELEDSYNIRRLMNESFNKSKSDTRQDFSKNVIKQLELEEEAALGFHPAIKLLIMFTISVLVITSIVLINLKM